MRRARVFVRGHRLAVATIECGYRAAPAQERPSSDLQGRVAKRIVDWATNILEGMEADMRQTKKVSKRRLVKEAGPVLGAVGVSLLAGGASVATAAPATVAEPPRQIPSHGITLNEEEISDVSLGTFFVFDKEGAGTSRAGQQLARSCGGCRGCGGRGCRGCGGCGGGCGGCGCSCCASWGICRLC
jgi:hypothetical protein